MKTWLSLAALAAFSFPTPALACSCTARGVNEAFRSAAVIFAGEVLDVQFVDVRGDNMFGERRTIVHFRVAGYWKGDVSQTITLHTIDNQVSCSGYDFKKGQQYLVYGSRAKAMYWLGYGDRRPELQGVTYPKSDDEIFGTSICSRTGPLSAARDIAELGSPKIPQ